MEKTNDYSLFLTKYLISLLTRQFTPIYPICALNSAQILFFRECCKNGGGQLFFPSLSLNLVTETVFHRREKQLILLCCCALLLEMRGSGSAATFNNGERIQSEVNGACIEPIHLFSRGLTKVSKYLFLPSTHCIEEHHVKRDLNPLDTSVSLGKLIRGMHHSKNPSVSST